MPRKGYKKDTTLTLFHETFVKEYLVDRNGSQAYIRAGGSPKSARRDASRLLHQPHVKAAVDAALKERFARLDDHARHVELTQQWVIEKLMPNVQRTMGESPLVDGDGNPTGTYRYHPEAANRALERHMRILATRLGVPNGQAPTLQQRVKHTAKQAVPWAALTTVVWFVVEWAAARISR